MSSAAVAWCSLALACCGLLRVSCEPVTGFLPYGVLNGDASLAPAESSAVVSLGLNLSFLGSSYSTAHVRTIYYNYMKNANSDERIDQLT